ncbi:tsl1081 [Thermosynechococcus vestitus BP-1]|uniref:Tsl1081 protein n=1 Tax=Thermosynechococcus vestitus (strain NIES-2133 / IAM M-273 / BP-1) TaxID=197221 RepID=Q8DJY9_THEVB|nr:tsl1081 [Thermosynechococcus vestitus BP-1]
MIDLAPKILARNGNFLPIGAIASGDEDRGRIVLRFVNEAERHDGNLDPCIHPSPASRYDRPPPWY